MSQPPPAKRPKGMDFMKAAMEEQALAPVAAPQKNVLQPRGNPLFKELLDFLTQVRRGIMGTLSAEESQRIASKQATVEVEARLGMITFRCGAMRVIK
jgi:hypothetical protein